MLANVSIYSVLLHLFLQAAPAPALVCNFSADRFRLHTHLATSRLRRHSNWGGKTM